MSYFARIKPNKVTVATTQTIVGVTTASAVVLPANINRLGGWLRNVSDSDITIYLGATAAAGQLIVLNPGDRFDISRDSYVYIGAVAAIHASTGTKNLEVVEL